MTCLQIDWIKTGTQMAKGSVLITEQTMGKMDSITLVCLIYWLKEFEYRRLDYSEWITHPNSQGV